MAAGHRLRRTGKDFEMDVFTELCRDRRLRRPRPAGYAHRGRPNQDLIKEFMERYALTEEGVTAMYYAKPTGVPALNSIYEKLAKDNPLLRQLNAVVEYGQVMPNIPQMGRFFSSVSAALQIATQGRASAQAALQEAEANMQPH